MNFLRIYKIFKQFWMFTLGSNLSFWFQLLLTFIFTEVFRLWYMWSYAFALILATIVLFFFQQFITFHQGNRKLIKRLIKFTSVTVGLYIPNWFLVLIITNWLNRNYVFQYNYLVGILIASIPYAIIYFIISRKWVFKVSS